MIYAFQGKLPEGGWQDIADYPERQLAVDHLMRHMEGLRVEGYRFLRTDTRLYAKDHTGSRLVFRIITKD